MKDQKSTWSRRQFLNSGIAGIAGMLILPKIGSSTDSSARLVRNAPEGQDIRLGL